MAAVTPTAPAGSAPGEKGLKSNAIGFVSNVVIATASTAPAYSLAATLGFIVAVQGVGLSAPAVLLVSFLPMLCIAFAYNRMNRADPDAGTSFAWVTRAMGPQLGWLSGWAIIAADIIVMASLAQIAGSYTFLLVGWQAAADSAWAVTLVGCVWIALMTLICLIGIELNALTQKVLLGAELTILALFAVVALAKGGAATHPSWSWIDPFHMSSWSALSDGVLLGLFIYWGWDSGVAVNEESENKETGPGRAAVLSTILLVLTYVIVSFAAQAYGGQAFLAGHQDDVLSALGGGVLGSPLDKLLVLAVLTSAAASTQTTILPTARTALSMARWRAIPEVFGRVSPCWRTPTVATVVDGRRVAGLVRAGQPAQPERARRLRLRPRLPDRLLLRPHGPGVRDLPPAGAAARRGELLLRRRAAVPGLRVARRRVREVLARLQPGRLQLLPARSWDSRSRS